MENHKFTTEEFLLTTVKVECFCYDCGVDSKPEPEIRYTRNNIRFLFYCKECHRILINICSPKGQNNWTMYTTLPKCGTGRAVPKKRRGGIRDLIIHHLDNHLDFY